MPVIDPLTGLRYVLTGRVVTMDQSFEVLNRGALYIDSGQLVAVQPESKPPPMGFEDSMRIETGGTIFPGLIDLHNHLSYDALPMWNVPEKYDNRAQWGRKATYRKLISGPMQVLGRSPYVEAIVRYVECKCLFGGVTSSQGIALYSNHGIRKFYRGLVRNVEQTDEDALPEADTKISDVEAKEVEKFLNRLKRSTCLLLHLSEGIDEKAHQHFEALKIAADQWAITPALSGIHCVGLKPADLQVMQKFGASMIWSPLSNLLLYGETANIKAATAAGILMGIGPDWSPTGSKNLLGELKIARLVSDKNGGVFSAREIVAMATTNAAQILKWEKSIGSLETGKRADIIVISDRQGDPYDRLLESDESSITLVVINGVPRYGKRDLMKRFGDGTESWKLGGTSRILNLEQETADPVVGKLTLKESQRRLKNGMRRLPELAEELEHRSVASFHTTLDTPEVSWYLVLDHNEVEGETARHHLPFGSGGVSTAFMSYPKAKTPLSQILGPLEVDELTAAGDDDYVERLRKQRNLPDWMKNELQ